MTEISAETHQFHRGKAPRDGNCLFWSVLGALKQTYTQKMNDDLRESVANCILNNDEFRNMVIRDRHSRWKTIEEYCSLLEKGRIIWGGYVELSILSILYDVIIYVISVSRGNKNVWPFPYGTNNPSATKCIYILYEELDHHEKEGHYDPLFLMNMQNTNEKETIFNPDDDIVNGCLERFIRKTFKFNGKIKLGIKEHVDVKEVSRPNDGSNETEIIPGLVVQNSPMKRKRIMLDDLLSALNNRNQVPITISKKYYDPNKRTKFADAAADMNAKACDNKTDARAIQRLLQTDMFEDVPVNEEETVHETTGGDDEDQGDKLD